MEINNELSSFNLGICYDSLTENMKFLSFGSLTHASTASVS